MHHSIDVTVEADRGQYYDDQRETNKREHYTPSWGGVLVSVLLSLTVYTPVYQIARVART